MNTIMNIFLVAIAPELSKDTTPMQMNTDSWLLVGVIIAILLLIYLIISLIKPDKF
ncbi:MAG: K(+)-transporting ATPase subunit F [Bacteroidota bacterium]